MNENSENTEEHEDKNHQHNGMGSRGVARPMSEHKSGDDGHEMKGMDDEQRRRMLYRHHRQTLWIYWMLIMLGIWMIMSPLTFSYSVGTVDPSGGREVWLSLSERITIMQWSDIISGILLTIFGWRTLTPNRPISIWICCFIGIWISMAPFIFWSPVAVAYLNGTLVGALVIALTILIPGMPNMIMYMKMGSETPPGWSYNPSSWPQRWIMIVTGFLGWVTSRYLGAYQLGYIETAWDPFFGASTVKILNSSVSHSWPVSDAALGTFAYTLECLMGFMGSPSRWRTMPWMVTFFGILVIPLGLVSIFLVISQPLTVGAWCTICLVTAIIMLPMIPLEIDEVIAMSQHMAHRKRKGDSLWTVFWKGGEPVENNTDKRSPELVELPQNPRKVFLASIWGMSFPWMLNVSAILGIWLMFAPAVFGAGIETMAANICHLIGALIVVVSVISMGEVVRAGRYLNILLGLAIAAAFLFFIDANLVFTLTSIFAGLVVAILSLFRGTKMENYGLWDKYVR